jgi:uncharacterized protein
VGVQAAVGLDHAAVRITIGFLPATNTALPYTIYRAGQLVALTPWRAPISNSNDNNSVGSGSTPPDPFKFAAAIKGSGPAPVAEWDPPFCGDIDMLIKRDGSWYHEGKPIRRPAMVRLFASILKKENDEFFLVTPAEKVRIQVEDCPFVITAVDATGEGAEQMLRFTTNTGEQVLAGAEHRIYVGTADNDEPHPLLQVRSGLDGLISRALFYRLVELADAREHSEETLLGVWSDGEFFALGKA